MKKLKKENNLMKENEKMNRHMVALSDEMLEQVTGGVSHGELSFKPPCRHTHEGENVSTGEILSDPAN